VAGLTNNGDGGEGTGGGDEEGGVDDDEAELARMRDKWRAAHSEQIARPGQLAEWVEVMDETTKRTAYYNPHSNRMQWHRPKGWVKIIQQQFDLNRKFANKSPERGSPLTEYYN
jgi:hypothetical protein